MAASEDRSALTAGFEPMSLLDGLPDPVVIVGLDARLAWANAAASSTLGWERDEWIGRDLSGLVHPDDLSTALLALDSVQAKPVGELMEIRVRDAAGTYRHLELRGRFAPDLPGIEGVVLAVRDVTDRRRWELAEGDDLALSAVLDALPTIAMVLTRDGRIRSTNRAFTRLLGHPLDAVVGCPLTDFVTIASTLVLSDRLLMAADGAGHLAFEVEMLSADGTTRPMSLTLVDLADDGAVDGLVATATDITELVEARERLRHAATNDELTALPNRATVTGHLSSALQRRHVAPVGLVVVDVDRFREINDRHGHLVGDAVLVELADRLGSAVRDGDLLGRLGSDEFAVVATGVGPDDLERLVDRVHWVMRPPVDVASGTARVRVRVTLGAGWVTAEPRESAEDLLARADSSMRREKLRRHVER